MFIQIVVEEIDLAALRPADWNPRLIKTPRFDALMKSMINDPEFMKLRPVLATKDGIIYAGNMRFRAAQKLGWKTIPCIITDISEDLAKERAVKDNNQFGEWDDTYSALLDEIEKKGGEIETLGLDKMMDEAMKSLDQSSKNEELDVSGIGDAMELRFIFREKTYFKIIEKLREADESREKALLKILNVFV